MLIGKKIGIHNNMQQLAVKTDHMSQSVDAVTNS